MSATQHPPFVLYRRLSYCYLSLIFNIISLYAKIQNLTLYKQYLKTLFDIILIRIFLNTINILLYDMPRTICAKRFSVLSQTIFQSTENDFQICRHPLYELYRAEHQIKRRCGCFPESILRFSTSHKRFFTRKGSLPSDLFYINVLR